MEVSSYSWFVDGVDYHTVPGSEPGALRDLAKIAELYPDLLTKIRELPWISEQITEPAGFALLFLVRLAATSLDLAILTVQSPWIIDGIGFLNDDAIAALDDIAKRDLELARRLLGYTLTPSVTDIDLLAIRRIRDYLTKDPNVYHILSQKPWYSDGLTAEERAFVAGVRFIPGRGDLPNPDSRKIESITISLPLTGELTIWAIDTNPLPPGEEALV